ncbi:TetR/AcrR family transcriptional regulator [Rhodococcus sp. B7740]|uniref:TetR/AcrR family transcriptional regulator n=1 Tax=Rhodococcus sp. B7740 TaxID=1564114 RepID=UPI0005EB7C9C|nr:TetR/AcrR family transcriptional regulator [Rhodococcus sp. B7740]
MTKNAIGTPMGSEGVIVGHDSDTKAKKTRARILDAAAHVLSKKGYAGMRLTDVAEVADLQAPAIYYYFASRETLIEEVMWVGVAAMRQHVGDAVAAATADASAMDRILIAVEAHLRHELDISDYATASIRNAGQLPEGIRERPEAEATLYGDLWRTLIKDAARSDQIRADLDLHIAHMLVIGALNWAAEWWKPERGSIDKLVTMATSFVEAGLAPHPTLQPTPPPTTRQRRKR